MKNKYVIAVFIMIILTSCQEWFSASPYAINKESDYKNINNSNILKIISPSFRSPKYSFQGNPALVLGFISDTHYYYDETANVIDAINRDTTVSVVLHGGDLTEKGLPDEFVFAARELDRLSRPVLTVIGNHDHLGTGYATYLRVFGETPGSCSRKTSYSTYIDADGVRVRAIMWDNNVWEAENSEPNFDWLERELTYASRENEVIVVLAHIPPWTDQFTGEMAERYNSLMVRYSVRLSIHGHGHIYITEQQTLPEPFKSSSVRYVVIGSTSFNSYMKAVITSSDLEIVRVEI